MLDVTQDGESGNKGREVRCFRGQIGISARLPAMETPARLLLSPEWIQTKCFVLFCFFP